MVVAGARIALATCAEFPDLDEDSALALPAFSELGIETVPAVWNDPGVDWAGFDAVVVRSVWDYFHHPAEFEAWIDRVEAVAPLWNPAGVLRWNAHKSYLTDLAAHGVPLVETHVLESGSAADLERLLSDHGWEDAVFKPAVAGGALGLQRVRGPGEARAAQPALDGLLAEGEVLVQPFLESIVDEGETSLLYFDGELSHTVLKQAKAGDIRVQPEYGGAQEIVDAPPEAEAIAARVFDAVGADLPYARVDLVRGHDGTLRLIELEVIEPRLFFVLDGDATGRYASAIAARLA